MSSNRPLRAVLLVSSLALLSACAFRHETKPDPARPLLPAWAFGDKKPTPVPTVSTPASAPIDLQKFMGTWYVIGRVPNPIERGHVASVNEFRLRGDQKVSIRYRYRDGFSEPQQELTVRASVDEKSGNHNWRTWFYKIVPTHTRVLEVAPDYSWAMLGYPGREMAWIFARKPDMDKDLYKELATRLRDQYGVNTDKLKRVPQHPEQVDRLGFEVPNVR